ncbi:MAG: hypothetical protein Q9165_002319 [Trypethelium subeluteriae]
MLFDWLYDTFIHPLNGAHPAIQGLLFTVSGLGFVYIVWRLWAFTVKPALHPDEPKELPYWIPDVSELYKSTQALVFDKIVYELSIMFGVTHGAMDNVYRRPDSEADDVVSRTMNIKNPSRKSLAQLNNDFWKQQLVPGEAYYNLQGKFLKYISDWLQPGNIKGPYVLSCSEKGEKTVSLLRWVQEVLLDAALRAFFGDKILEIEPNLPKYFLEFDDDNWKLWYKWPKADDMHAAKDRVSKTIQRYLALPKSERPGASFIVETFEKTQRALGTSEEDLAKIFCMVVFVTNTNTYKVLFWTMAYMLHNPDLLDIIRKETAPALRPEDSDTPFSLSYLMDSCPYLAGVFHEALRLCSASSSIRLVTAPITIGGKKLPQGSRVIVPFRQMHFDGRYFGQDVDSFNPERFVKNKNLTHSPSYRPFGGGISYCPGRFIARQEVGVFITLLLHRFDVGLGGNRKFPELNNEKPTTGLMDPKPGEDVHVVLRPKV